MTDEAKLADAMLKLADAIKELSAKIPSSNGLGTLTIYHQHTYPQQNFGQYPQYGQYGTYGGRFPNQIDPHGDT